jgi:hypothetical protein
MKHLLSTCAVLLSTTAFLAPSASGSSDDTICNGVLPAGVYEDVFVPAGASCFTGAGVTITDTFTAQDPAVIELIDTPVGHNLYIDGATRHVKIGSVGCRLDPTVANNLHVSDSRNVAICEMTVENNLHVTHSTGRIMVRDNVVCDNIQIQHNDVQALRVWRNRFGNQLQMQDNTVRPDRTFVTGNALDPALHDC